MSEEQAQYRDRRADSQALLAELRTLREQMSAWADKLQKMEVNHEARIFVLERENLRISEALDAIMTRLSHLDASVAAIPAAIKEVIQRHEIQEKNDKIEILQQHLKGVRNIVGGVLVKVIVAILIGYLVLKFPGLSGVLQGIF